MLPRHVVDFRADQHMPGAFSRPVTHRLASTSQCATRGNSLLVRAVSSNGGPRYSAASHNALSGQVNHCFLLHTALKCRDVNTTAYALSVSLSLQMTLLFLL